MSTRALVLRLELSITCSSKSAIFLESMWEDQTRDGDEGAAPTDDFAQKSFGPPDVHLADA